MIIQTREKIGQEKYGRNKPFLTLALFLGFLDMDFVGGSWHQSADFVGGAQFPAAGEISAGLRLDEEEELFAGNLAESKSRLSQNVDEVGLETGELGH